MYNWLKAENSSLKKIKQNSHSSLKLKLVRMSDNLYILITFLEGEKSLFRLLASIERYKVSLKLLYQQHLRKPSKSFESLTNSSLLSSPILKF